MVILSELMDWPDLDVLFEKQFRILEDKSRGRNNNKKLIAKYSPIRLQGDVLRYFNEVLLNPYKYVQYVQW